VTPERWQQIKELLATALELPPAERSEYLRTHSLDASIQQEVERLLADEPHVREGFLDDSDMAVAAAAALSEPAPWIGRRVGSYRIVECIGVGGMGEVYRAFRADDQYRKEVALKVIRSGQDSGFVIGRFKNERQILANLDHPNIARLLDGGSSEDGAPYLVMELIEGEPITDFSDRKEMSIAKRLELFCEVCAAVQYAHQRLIVHRDIKPGNILVTADGAPKLLDFGIAKILDFGPSANSPDLTLTAFPALTPRYASPEQIKGEPVTTASDIFSLGVVLYELLTGVSPYPSSARTPQDLAQAACCTEALKPSMMVGEATGHHAPDRKPRESRNRYLVRATSAERLQKQLAGDLDNIVLMALRKEPSRRYPTVDQLAGDIRRHLDNVPVLARKDTVGYRASKFIRRHKAGVAASIFMLATILAGSGIALREAHIARRQAEIARDQRARAERRFNDVRKLANSMVFEIHDSIRNLPGAMPARKLLATRALEYLDSLSQEAGGDLSLQRELAAAYDRIGDLQGYNGAANLGDFENALKSYNKALAIRELSATANPQSAQIQGDLLGEYFRLSFAQQEAGDSGNALEQMRKALPIAEKLAATHSEPMYQDWLAGIYWQSGYILARSGRFVEALQDYRHSFAIRDPVASDKTANEFIRAHLAGDYTGIGEMLWRQGNMKDAAVSARKGLGILQQLSLADPTNATFREYLGEAYSNLRMILQSEGDGTESVDCARKALHIFSVLAAADATNRLAKSNQGFAEVGLGEALIRQNQISAGLLHIQRAKRLFESLQVRTRYDTAGLAETYSGLAIAYSRMADREVSAPAQAARLREAKRWYEKSWGTWQMDPNHGSPDPSGGNEGEQVRQELAKITTRLAAVKPSQPPGH
jgi:serine/threonine protein kinase